MHVCSSFAGVCGLHDNLEYATPEAACQAADAENPYSCRVTKFKSLLEAGDFSLSREAAIKYGATGGIQYYCLAEVTSRCSGVTVVDAEDERILVWCLKIKSKPSISLTPAPNQSPPDPRPKGTEGKDPKSSTHELIAKVTENGSPKAGVAVSFKVEVKEGSGEHGVTSNGDHVHANRPKGKITPLTEKTNTSGEIRIKFESADPAGTHIVTATCETCSNKTATKDIKVLVPDLVELTPDKGIPKTFDLVGNTKYPGTNHLGNHYFTAAAKETLVNNVIPKMIEAGWGVVGVNDGSLKDGGLFDIYGNWTTSDAGHRTGTEVDISFKQPKGVGDKTVQKAYEKLCIKDGAAFDIQTLWHKNDGYEPHYHIYLNGSGLPSGPKEKCCERNRTPKKDKEGNIVLHTSGKNKGQPVYLYFCEEKPLAQ